MNRKWVCWLVVIALVFVALLPGTSNALAEGAQPAAQAGLSIGSFVSLLNGLKLRILVMQANWQIEMLVKKAQSTPYNDVPQTLRQIESIVNGVFRYAASIGAVVECEYVQYYIDGQYVMIDPIRIVSL